MLDSWSGSVGPTPCLFSMRNLHFFGLLQDDVVYHPLPFLRWLMTAYTHAYMPNTSASGASAGVDVGTGGAEHVSPGNVLH